MSNAQSIPSGEMQPGDHIGAVYQSDEAQRALLLPFVRQGLESGHKVICVVDANTVGVVLDWLREAGVEVRSVLSAERLSVVPREAVYLRGGAFEPQRVLAWLQAQIAQALAEGYTALRVTGEMSWAVRGLAGGERFLEYEAQLDEFLRGNAALMLCQYDRRRFAAEMLLDIVHMHPVIGVEGEICADNFYYVPPEELTAGDAAEFILRRRLQSLTRHHCLAQRLQESEGCVQMLWRAPLSAGLILTDREGVILNLNALAARLLGRRASDLIGQRLGELCLPEFAVGWIECWERALASGQPTSVAESEVAGEGVYFYPVPEIPGGVSQVMILVGDNDQRRRWAAVVRQNGQHARRALKEMYLLGYELQSAPLTNMRLETALRHRLEMVERRAGIEAHLITEPLGVLPTTCEEAVYTIAIHALNNILKNTEAVAVWVRLLRRHSGLRLEISLQGEGEEWIAVADSVETMRRCARRVGGRLEIRSLPTETEKGAARLCLRLDVDLRPLLGQWLATEAGNMLLSTPVSDKPLS